MSKPKQSLARRRLGGVLLLVLAASLLQPGSADAVASGSVGYAWGDFNDDGRGDLAIGAPGEKIGRRQNNAGAVTVLFGGPVGLGPNGSQLWHQNSAGVPGAAERGDAFGASLAAGDFDGDGTDDIAIGSPGEDIDGAVDAGSVTVLFGRAGSGLSSVRGTLMRQGSHGIPGNEETGDRFGASLAAGNFNIATSPTDLAVGAPGESIDGESGAGLVQILNGQNPGGLTGVDGETIHQNAGLEGGNEIGDQFGHSMTVGDFNGDDFEDLAIGTPFEDVGSLQQAGAVWVIYGSISGPDLANTHFMTQDTIFTDHEARENDAFGYSLAAGNFAKGNDLPNEYDDLAIGAPGDLTDSSGSVSVMYGSTEGFVSVAELWYQNAPGTDFAVAGTREPGDNFGFSLTANDFNGDGRCDLGIGVPGEDEPKRDEGAVVIIYGSPLRLEPGVGPSQVWTQDSGGIRGSGETGDSFGVAITSGNFSSDAFADLAIGVPGEDIGDFRDAGSVSVLYGAPTKLAGSNSDLWHQNIQGIRGSNENGDRFGGAVR